MRKPREVSTARTNSPPLALHALMARMDESLQSRAKSAVIRLGFVAQADCAPLAVAAETGIFKRYGLRVELGRELGWAGIRDKIFNGGLDAAQTPAGLAFALSLGLGELKCDVAVPLIMNLHGHAVTFTKRLPPAAIGHGEGLRDYLTRAWSGDRPFTVAAPHRFSSQHILLHQWLRKHGLSVPGDLELIFLPGPVALRQLAGGRIDGFCVGEPWHAAAIHSGEGWCVAQAHELAYGHPDKVLLLEEKFLHQRKDDVLLLVAALLDACKLAAEPGFRKELEAILRNPRYACITPRVDDEIFRSGAGISGDTDAIHRPTVEKASWVLAGLRAVGILPDVTCGSLSRIYREDLYHHAAQSRLAV